MSRLKWVPVVQQCIKMFALMEFDVPFELLVEFLRACGVVVVFEKAEVQLSGRVFEEKECIRIEWPHLGGRACRAVCSLARDRHSELWDEGADFFRKWAGAFPKVERPVVACGCFFQCEEIVRDAELMHEVELRDAA